MARLFVSAAIAMLAMAGAAPSMAKTSETAPTVGIDQRPMPEKIRSRLSEDGYKDITIMPTSYVVTATDKDGKPVLLLIGPDSSTVLEGVQEDQPSTAESKDGGDKVIQH